jgi:hypothetical protein
MANDNGQTPECRNPNAQMTSDGWQMTNGKAKAQEDEVRTPIRETDAAAGADEVWGVGRGDSARRAALVEGRGGAVLPFHRVRLWGAWL